MKPRRELGLFDVVLFNIAATIGVQSISASAHIGPLAIPLHLSAALLFFVPSALVVASLSRRFPEEGGFYVWTKRAFGDWHGFLCGWLWWLSVLLYLPGLLLTGAGMAAEALHGPLGDDGRFVSGFTLLVLWLIVGANILGLRVSKWLSNSGASLIYLAGVIVCCAAVALWVRDGSATPFVSSLQIRPDTVNLWAQIAFAYIGLELGSVLGGEIRDPERTIPKAAWISAAGVTAAHVAGIVSLMLVLPPEQIHPMTGLTGVASVAGARLGANWLGALAAVLLFAGIIGKLSTWAGGSARLPFVIGIDGAFPQMFGRLHPRWGTPYISLIVQGAICSAFLVLTQAGETLRAGWQVLVDMSVLCGFLPFIYIFLSAWKFGHRWSAACGLFVTTTAIALTLVPPQDVLSVWWFETKVLGGCALLAGLGRVAFNGAVATSRRRAS